MTAICGGVGRQYRRRVRFCPVELRRRRFAAFSDDWYGATWTCLGCGDRWTDGEMHERPFRPGWRMANVAEAKRTWALAGRSAAHEAVA